MKDIEKYLFQIESVDKAFMFFLPADEKCRKALDTNTSECRLHEWEKVYKKNLTKLPLRALSDKRRELCDLCKKTRLANR
jgi:hypothetical protein